MLVTETFSSSGINWKWFLTVEYSDGWVKILRHWLIHNSEKQPITLGGFYINEGENRIAQTVELYHREVNSKNTYKVLNPKNIFEYN